MSLNEQQLIAVAQAYGIKHWLSSPLSGAKRKILEHFWDKYRDHMEVLRTADEAMRAEASRFDEYLGNAKAAYKQKRYIDVAHWIGQINLGSHRMLQQSQQVVDLKSEHLAEQFGQSTEADPDADYFTPPPAESGGFTANAAMEVEAGMMDDIKSRISGNFLEKMYWKQTQARKIALDILIKNASRYVENIKRVLNSMGHARAQGNLGNWIHEAQKIVPLHQRFQADFKSKYDTHVHPLVQAVRKSQPKPEVKPEEPKAPPAATAPATKPTPKAEEPKIELQQEPEKVAPKVKPSEPKSTPPEAAKPEIKPESKSTEEETVLGRPPKETTPWDQLEQLMKGLKGETSSETPSSPEAAAPSAPSAEAPKRRGRPPGKKPSVPPSAPEAVAPSTEVLPGPTDDKLEALKKLVQEQAASPATEAPVRRGPGRPRKTPSVIPPSAAPEAAAPSAPTAPEPTKTEPTKAEPAKTEPTVVEKSELLSNEELAKLIKFNESSKKPIILLTYPPDFELKKLPGDALRKVVQDVNNRPIHVQPMSEDKVEKLKESYKNQGYDDIKVVPVSAVVKDMPKATTAPAAAAPTEAPRRGPGRPRKEAPSSPEAAAPPAPSAPSAAPSPAPIESEKSIVLMLAPPGSVDSALMSRVKKQFKTNEIKRVEDREEFDEALKDLESKGYSVHKLEVTPKGKKSPEAAKSETPTAKPAEKKTAVIFVTKPNADKAEQDAQVESAKNKAKEKDWMFGGVFSDDDSLSRMEALEKAGYKVELVEYKEPKLTTEVKPEAEVKPETKPAETPIQVGLEGKEKGKAVPEDSDLFYAIQGIWTKALTENKDLIKSLPKTADGNIDLGKIKSLPGLDSLANSKSGINFISMMFGIPEKKKLFEAQPVPLTEAEKQALYPFDLKDVAQQIEDLTKKVAFVSPINSAIKYTHQRFFNELKKVASTGNKYLMASMMAAYSEKIDEIDPDMSMKLLVRARKIVNV